MRAIAGLLDVLVPIAWGLSMIALPIGFIIMIFGGGGSVFVNAVIVVTITTALLWAARRLKA